MDYVYFDAEPATMTDVDELLALIRYCTEQIAGFDSEDPGDSGECADLGRKLAEATARLDHFLSGGARLPRAWRNCPS